MTVPGDHVLQHKQREVGLPPFKGELRPFVIYIGREEVLLLKYFFFGFPLLCLLGIQVINIDGHEIVQGLQFGILLGKSHRNVRLVGILVLRQDPYIIWCCERGSIAHALKYRLCFFAL